MAKKINKSKSNEARAVLIGLSRAAKEQRELMVLMADTPEKKLFATTLTVNDVLIINYKKESGCQLFKTFHDWKNDGYKVKKGEKAFRIWGKPIKALKKSETDTSNEDQEFKMFPMCCVFNELQVEKNDCDDYLSVPVCESEPVNEVIEPALSISQDELETLDNPYVSVDYDEQQEARKDRLHERASKKRTEANGQYKCSHELVEHIPMGQPILVGHHSERAHRNALDKSWNALGKSVKLGEYADHLDSRAAGVGSAGIASNDPEVLIKLNGKLCALVSEQDKMKAANRAIRKGNDQALIDLGYTDGQIAEIKKPDFAGRIGFADYALQNNNAEIRRTKKRIEEIKKLHNREPIDYSCEDFRMGVDNGRVQVSFTGGKPSEQVRALLKSYSFKWSRFSESWVRKATLNGVCSAERLCDELKDIEVIY